MHPKSEPKPTISQANNVIVAVDGPLKVKTVPAAPTNYSRHRRSPIDFIVIHCTDGCEGYCKDDDVAAMFANPRLMPRRSCHYVVDSDSITQCVPDAYKAWHCGGTGNKKGLGLELCGRARQTKAEWLDELSLPMLNIAARWAADKCLEYRLPPTFVTSEGLLRGDRGITTHAMVGAAWRQTTHTDPGPNFPMLLFIDAVKTTLGKK